jgi:hypothetical protein
MRRERHVLSLIVVDGLDIVRISLPEGEADTPACVHVHQCSALYDDKRAGHRARAQERLGLSLLFGTCCGYPRFASPSVHA